MATIIDLEKQLQQVAEWHAADPAMYPPYVNCEIGRYKPYNQSTIAAARRRGYRTEGRRHVVRVYIKGA